jgi:hypothetical protein
MHFGQNLGCLNFPVVRHSILTTVSEKKSCSKKWPGGQAKEITEPTDTAGFLPKVSEPYFEHF